jgi:hypothetical protein
LVVAIAIWSARRSKRHGALIAAAMLPLLLHPLGASAASVCPGDCDESRTVSVHELVVGVRIALGNAMLEACPSFDSDASNEIEVAELIAAASHALNGCPAAFAAGGLAQLLPALRAMDQTASVLQDALHFFNGSDARSRSSAVTSGFTVAGASTSECPRGGSDERTCEVLDGSLVRIPYRLDACSFGGNGPRITVDGYTALIGFGSCPGLFLPSAARFEMNQVVTRWDSAAADHVVSQTSVDIAGIVDTVDLRQGFCTLAGTVLSFGGHLAIASASSALSIEIEGAEIDTSFGGFPCLPRTTVLLLDGSLQVQEDDETVDLETDGLTLERRFEGDVPLLTVGGVFDLAETGESVFVATIERLRLGERCPIAGSLKLGLQGTTAAVVFRGDASIALDLDGDGAADTEMASCDDPPAAIPTRR